jgi:hypothetical protein
VVATVPNWIDYSYDPAKAEGIPGIRPNTKDGGFSIDFVYVSGLVLKVCWIDPPGRDEKVQDHRQHELAKKSGRILSRPAENRTRPNRCLYFRSIPAVSRYLAG